MTCALIVKREEAQMIRQLTERYGIWDSGRRLKTISPEKIAIPITVDSLTWEDIGLSDRCQPCQIEHLVLPPSKTSKLETPLNCLRRKATQLLLNAGRVASPELLSDLPSHWEKHGDLILVSESAFCSEAWSLLGEILWKTVCGCLGGSRLAKKSSVSTDGFRSPSVTLLCGEDGWVEHVDNKIRYSYDVTRCMFSIGNITEKLRVAQFDCKGETVLDLYAGIGYFTLPYLVHAKAERVIACEWNPDAVEALKKNLCLNNVQDRCTVYLGDNRQTCPNDIADRVNLGLIPSSEPGWSVACAALRCKSGGILHIHGNVTSKASNTCNNSSSTCTTDGCVNEAQAGVESESGQKGPHVSESALQSPSCAPFCPESGQMGAQEEFCRVRSGTGQRLDVCERPDHGNVTDDTQRMTMTTDSPKVCGGGAGSLGFGDGADWSDLHSESPEFSCNGTSSLRCGDGIAHKTELENSETGNVVKLGALSFSEQPVTGLDKSCLHEKTKDTPNLGMEFTTCSDKEALRYCGSAGPATERPVTISCNQKIKPAWYEWAEDVSTRISDLLESHHQKAWVVRVLHLEHVKSYAPHIDHMVLDLECRPVK